MWRSALLTALLLLTTPAHANAITALKASIHSFFARGIYSEGARAELVEVVQWPTDITGTIRWRMPHINNHPKRISLIAEKGRGKNQRRWYIPVRLHWWADVIVVKTDLPARTLLSPSMLTQKRADIAGHPGHWWKDIVSLAGTRLTRPLRGGQAIYAPYIKRPQLLKRGDHVTMIASIGGLKVKASGKVMHAAGLGDRVQVRNISSKKMLQAIVVDASTVHVVTGGRG